MWPFKKRVKEPDWRLARGELVEREFPLGSHFRHMGIDMVVVGHAIPVPVAGFIPAVVAHYQVDGELHHVEFIGQQVFALLEERRKGN